MTAALEGFPYRKMAGPHLCGPTALASVLEYQDLRPGAEELERAWGFIRGSDRTDTPGHHLRTLRRLGIPYAIRTGLTIEQIGLALSAGRAPVVLVSAGRMLRHWVVVTCLAENLVRLAWGDKESPTEMPLDRFETIFSGGALDTLMRTRRLGYVVGEPPPWPSTPGLGLYFGLQRPLAQWIVLPFVETVLGGLRRSSPPPGE